MGRSRPSDTAKGALFLTSAPHDCYPRPRVVLLSDAHFEMVYDDAVRVVSLRRTTAPFSTISQMRDGFEAVNRILDGIGRSTISLVVDTREAPPRNDPDFEKAFAPLRSKMFRGLRRAAVLVATPIGRLQVERHAREDKTGVRAFTDAAEARTYCASR